MSNALLSFELPNFGHILLAWLGEFGVGLGVPASRLLFFYCKKCVVVILVRVCKWLVFGFWSSPRLRQYGLRNSAAERGIWPENSEVTQILAQECGGRWRFKSVFWPMPGGKLLPRNWVKTFSIVCSGKVQAA